MLKIPDKQEHHIKMLGFEVKFIAMAYELYNFIDTGLAFMNCTQQDESHLSTRGNTQSPFINDSHRGLEDNVCKYPS